MTEGSPIDFEQAQFEQPAAAALACKPCGAPLSTYHTVNGEPHCAPCLQRAEGSRVGSFFKALLLGCLAAAAGALLYYGIRAITGLELGLVAIVVGIMVGVGVRMGAGGRTSIVYRLMAVALAYVSITSTYLPMVVQGLMADDEPQASAEQGEGVPDATADLRAEAESPGDSQPRQADVATYVLGMFIALLAPAFFAVEAEIMMLIILAIGLWEAWRLSGPREHAVLGPFTTARSEPAHAPQDDAPGTAT